MATTTQYSISCINRAAFRASAPRLTAVNRAHHSTTTAYRTVQRSLVASNSSQSAPSTSILPFARHASTTSAGPSSTSSSPPIEQPALTWDEFLKLRRTRRFINLGASVFSGLGSIVVAAPIMAEYEIENIGAQMTGMDPVFVLGGSLATVGAVGWLMGPFLGTAVFKLWKSSVTVEFARVCAFPTPLTSCLSTPRASYSRTHTDMRTEREGFLCPHQALPRRPSVLIRQQSRTRLLWGEDKQCVRLQAVAERPKGVQQEEEQEHDMSTAPEQSIMLRRRGISGETALKTALDITVARRPGTSTGTSGSIA